MAEVMRQERQNNPERISNFKELLGMQGRLILADQKYLDPNIKDVPLIDDANPLANFQNRNYNPFENTSKFDRQEYWRQKAGGSNFETQYGAWKESMTSLFNKESNKGKLDKLKPYLTKIGIDADTFGSAQADSLYDRYFRQGNQPLTGVKLFVDDVISAYATPEGIDVQGLKNNLTEIQWWANIFGGKSSEIVSQLVDAETSLIGDPQFAEKLNQKHDGLTQLNHLNDKEKELLKHIIDHGELAEKSEGGKKREKGEGIIEEVDEDEEERKGPLPILAQAEKIKGLLSDSKVDNIIISAGTGAGKSTQLPIMALDVMEEGQKMMITQPRRIAAEDVSKSMSLIMGEELGEKVAYIHGKGKMTSEKSVAFFITEGSLKRAVDRDKEKGTGLLLDYDKIMFDEVHEMNIDLQMDMDLIMEIQKKRKELLAQGMTHYQGKKLRPLQLIFASATSNEKALKDFVPGAEFVPIPGAPAKIQEIHETKPIPRDEKPERAAYWVSELIKKRKKGRTILIFMPGDTLIRETVNKIKELNLPDTRVLPLTGTLSSAEQNDATNPDLNKYNIVVASPVAETSLTIKKVVVSPDGKTSTLNTGVDVISSGYVNVPRVDEDTGLNWLEEKLHARKGLTQQRGRGGRMGASAFIFLGTKEEWDKGVTENGVFKPRPEFAPNPITQSDLISQVLFLKAFGKEISDMRFMEKPNQKNVDRAHKQLITLGALGADGEITDIGRQMDKIPTDPHLARMIVEAQRKGCGEAACSITAMMETRTLFVKPNDKLPFETINESRKSFQVEGSDFLSLLNVWRQYSAVPEDQRKEWAKRHHLREDILAQVGARRKELMERAGISDVATTVPRETIEKCVVAGYKDKVLRRNAYTGRRNEKATYSLIGEPVNNAGISRDSVLMDKNYPMFISAGNDPRQREGKRGIIYMLNNQRVDPDWL